MRRQKTAFEDWQPRMVPVPYWQQVAELDREGVPSREIRRRLGITNMRLQHERMTARLYRLREERRNGA